MLHYKCEGCRLRLARTEAPEDFVGELCPGCGALLESVARLSEIVGFRAIQGFGTSERHDAGAGHRRLAARVRDLRGF